MFRLFVSFTFAFATFALGQDRIPSHCLAFAQNEFEKEQLTLAAYDAPVPAESVRIIYLDHSMFLVQTPGGLNAITDYNGSVFLGDLTPDVVTMNHAHDSHFTLFPDADIPHVLKGWGNSPLPAEHHLELGEMLIRNVATDIRGRFGGPPEINGNSIFIFEAAGLCIGHLGHLHHEPTEAQYAAIGRLDVVMAAVDGGMTLPTETMVQIMKRFKSSVVIPMHWFGRFTLDQFLADMKGEFDIVETGGSDVILGLNQLPSKPTVLVLEPLQPQSYGFDD